MALKAGFRHIDSAEGYNNEAGTGKAIKASGLSRDNIFVTTKLLPGYKPWGCPEKNYGQTIKTLKNQLKQVELSEFMKDNSIAPIAYSSLAPLSTWRSEEGQGGEVLAERKSECQVVIRDVAAKLGVSEAQLLLRWGLHHGYSVLTKSSRPERIQANLELFAFEILINDMDRFNLLDQNQAFAWAANGMNPMEVAPPLK